VLLGDMSLIGPRPLLPEDQPMNLLTRLSVRPGLTGWAQVNGGKLVTKEAKETFDEWYVRNASLVLDFQITLMTLKILMTHRYAGQEADADAEQVKQKGLGALAAADTKASS
jgi:lipopolysaccharide/colanic/teichoic acid biosynthesis glycosyltransferase